MFLNAYFHIQDIYFINTPPMSAIVVHRVPRYSVRFNEDIDLGINRESEKESGGWRNTDEKIKHQPKN